MLYSIIQSVHLEKLSFLYEAWFTIVMRRTMFEVLCLKPKIRCSSSITKRWSRLSSSDVWKNDVRVSSMSNLVNIEKVPLSLMFVHSKPKIGCSSSITDRWTSSSLLDVWKNDVRVSSKSNFVNLVKALLGLKFNVWSFEAKNRVFEFDYHKMNTFEFVRCSKKWYSSQFDEWFS